MEDKGVTSRQTPQTPEQPQDQASEAWDDVSELHIHGIPPGCLVCSSLASVVVIGLLSLHFLLLRSLLHCEGTRRHPCPRMHNSREHHSYDQTMWCTEYIFCFKFFSIICYYKILNVAPCAIQYVLVILCIIECKEIQILYFL